MAAKAKPRKSARRKTALPRAEAVRARAPKLASARPGRTKEFSRGPAAPATPTAPSGKEFPEPNGAKSPPAAHEHEETVSIRERTSYDGDTAIKLYLREIGQVKLLTP